MTISHERATFLTLLHTMFGRLEVCGSPESRAYDLLYEWTETMRNQDLRDYLEWEALRGFDDRAARAMFSMSPHDIAVLLNGYAKARKAVLDALEKRLECEAEADICWMERDRHG